ncbi:MAG: hypothetical protein NZM31_14170 [Gemmatales bacterium]|nr:hypothetical protein [Gemmatales bacterium]MDW8388142.1 hypothetical protein [Gemmatales bacterium]
MIVVTCPCGQVLRASEAFAGTKVTCPRCRKAVTIPATPSSSEPTDGPQTATAPLVDLKATVSDS